jgi:hypothetical protein
MQVCAPRTSNGYLNEAKSAAEARMTKASIKYVVIEILVDVKISV